MADDRGSMAIVKGRFASEAANIYGLLEVVVNLEDRQIKKVGVAAGPEKNLYSDLKPNASLADFQKYLYGRPKGMMAKVTNEIQGAVEGNLNQNADLFTELTDKANYPGLIDMVSTIIKKTFLRAADLEMELNIDQMIPPEMDTSMRDPSRQDTPQTKDTLNAGAGSITRGKEPPRTEKSLLEEAGGKITGIEIRLVDEPPSFPLSKLEKGDVIPAIITDRRMVATNLDRSLKRNKDGRIPVTVESVRQNKKSDTKVIVVIKPKVLGVATLAVDAKVKVISKAERNISQPHINSILSYVLVGAAVIAAILAAIFFLSR